jgi:hypothetical protein
LLRTPESEIFEDTYIQLQELENSSKNEGFDSLVKSLDKINFTIRSFSKETKASSSICKGIAALLLFGGILVLNDYILLKHLSQ